MGKLRNQKTVIVTKTYVKIIHAELDSINVLVVTKLCRYGLTKVESFVSQKDNFELKIKGSAS